MNKTQQVLAHLKDKGTITQFEAWNRFNASRLSSIIYNLKARGYFIRSEWVYGDDCNGIPTRWVQYRLLSEEDLCEAE